MTEPQKPVFSHLVPIISYSNGVPNALIAMVSRKDTPEDTEPCAFLLSVQKLWTRLSQRTSLACSTFPTLCFSLLSLQKRTLYSFFSWLIICLYILCYSNRFNVKFTEFNASSVMTYANIMMNVWVVDWLLTYWTLAFHWWGYSTTSRIYFRYSQLSWPIDHVIMCLQGMILKKVLLELSNPKGNNRFCMIFYG